MDVVIQPLAAVIRPLWAFAVVFVLPGYAVVRALLPWHRLDVLERVYLTALLSLLTTGLVTFALVRLGVTLTPGTVTVSMAALCLLLALAVLLPRWLQSRGRRAAPQVLTRRERSGADLILLAATGLVISVIAAGAEVAEADAEGGLLPMTEFYITPSALGSRGLGFDASPEVAVVPLTIVNRQGRAATYRVEGVLTSEKPDEAPPTVSLAPASRPPQAAERYPYAQGTLYLADGETWSGVATVDRSDHRGADCLQLRLYMEPEPITVGTLRICMEQE